MLLEEIWLARSPVQFQTLPGCKHLLISTYIGALVDVEARGQRGGRRGDEPVAARARVRAGRVAALAAAARPRAACTLVHVSTRATVGAELPAVPKKFRGNEYFIKAKLDIRNRAGNILIGRCVFIGGTTVYRALKVLILA